VQRPIIHSWRATTLLNQIDANNLYGDGMINSVLVGKFQFLPESKIDQFDLMCLPPDEDTGYIVECNLAYSEHLHSSLSDYPLAPDHLIVTAEMLSPFATQFVDKHWKSSKKLIPNLLNKTKYETHYRNLQFYINHGLPVTKIHRILSFQQRPSSKRHFRQNNGAGSP